jgi:signal peptidase II
LWATSVLPANGGRLVAVPGWLSFSLLKNSGGTFSLLSNHNLFFAGASLVVLVAVTLVLVRGYFSNPVSVVALGAVAGGAAGNLLDRIRLQGVVDFIHLRWWPTYFNLADVAIRVGVLVFLATLVFEQATRRRRPD